MTIRELSLETDHAAIERLAGHFLDSTYYGAMFAAEARAERIGVLASTLEATGVILGAEVAGEVVGMIGLMVLEHPLNGKPYAVELCWWVEQHKRQGRVGIELLQAAERWACSKNCSMLQMVAPSGSRIGRYYARIGYRELETAWIKPLG